MKTYEDLIEAGTVENDRMQFVRGAISEYKFGQMYKEADDAYQYFCKRNVTIAKYQKLLYTISGVAVPDNFSANYKFTNAFFPIFVKQENSHLLGNGVTFEEDGTKEALGGDDFDIVLTKAGEAALWGGVSYGFYNLDHVDVFKATEFVPLIGEEDGGLHAGIRFWQVDSTKPLRATLYEQDGYTEYIWDADGGRVLHDKRKYVQIIQTSEADGDEIIDGENYPGFPIVPLWGNNEHQSELTGLREKIDGYDLIQSGFANDLDDASQIYWTITNAGGMDDIDLAKFVERMKVVRAAVVDDSGSQAEAHTVEVPYQARMQALTDIRDSLYRDAMALDTDKISAGNVTATAIEASYENLNLKCDAFEMNVIEFIKSLLELVGIEDNPTFKRSKIVNMEEDTQMVLQAAQYLDDETILKHLPFLSPDEIDDILARKTDEEASRYENDFEEEESAEESYEEEPEEESEDEMAAEAEGLDTADLMAEYGDEVESMLNELLGEL